MKRTLNIFACCVALLLLVGCDVHEWPEAPEFVRCHLSLTYQTEMTQWEHLYEDKDVVEKGYGATYDNCRTSGQIRYIVRTFPISEEQRTLRSCVQEFVFTKDAAGGYDHEVTLELLPGDYTMMVWSDLVESSEDTLFYDAEDFNGVELQGAHRGCNDFRDAFCGQRAISLPRNDAKQEEVAVEVGMKRPLAKFEIVASDLLEFVNTNGGDIGRYKAKIHYIGYVPSTYSLFARRPVASATGVTFESSMTKLSDSQLSLGYDYVFVSDNGSMVTVRIGIYDSQDRQISLTEPITIPIKPDHHTLLKGEFLMQNASNGVYIDPNWGGDYNIVL